MVAKIMESFGFFMNNFLSHSHFRSITMHFRLEFFHFINKQNRFLKISNEDICEKHLWNGNRANRHRTHDLRERLNMNRNLWFDFLIIIVYRIFCLCWFTHSKRANELCVWRSFRSNTCTIIIEFKIVLD